MQLLNDLILEKNSRICAGLDVKWEDIPNAFKLEYSWYDEKAKKTWRIFHKLSTNIVRNTLML